MLYAIRPGKVGSKVGHRPILNVGDALAGEFPLELPADVDPSNLVLDADGQSLRERDEVEGLDTHGGPKGQARDRVRNAFAAAFDSHLILDGRQWHTGERSASRINGAAMLAAALGETTVVLTDRHDTAHEVAVGEAASVAARVGRHWRTRFYQRQELMQAIDQATEQAQLDALVIPDDWHAGDGYHDADEGA